VNRTKRPLLTVVLASIAVNALLGIYALLAPHFGDLQWKVLGTSACVTGAGVFSLACFPALEQRRLWRLPIIGIAASVLGFSLLVVAIWFGGGDTLGKTIGSTIVVAGFGVLSSVLALARLAPRYRWTFIAAVILAGLLALVIIGGIWGGPSGSAYPRVVGVIAVLLASVTLAIPILHRASRAELLASHAAGPGPGVGFCPACGAPVTATSGRDGACTACGIRFRVEYLEASRP
jgi:hypothetical protein